MSGDARMRMDYQEQRYRYCLVDYARGGLGDSWSVAGSMDRFLVRSMRLEFDMDGWVGGVRCSI